MSKRRVLTDYFKPKPDAEDQDVNDRETKRAVLEKDPPRLSQESSKSPNRTVVPDSEGEEDSDDSFEDVVWVKPSSLPAPVKEEKSKKKRDLPISTKPETPKYNFSLDALVAQREKDDAREQAFERIQAKIFEASDDHVTDLPGAPTSQGVIDAAVGGEHGEKLTAMLNRREAWRVEYTWYFFGQDGQPNRNNPFPTTQLNGWSVLLKEPQLRHSMYLNGYVQDMVYGEKGLPDEVFAWMLDELCLEPRDDLSYAYMKTLEASPPNITKLLDEAKVIQLFELLGGKKEAINIHHQIGLEETDIKSRPRNTLRNRYNIKFVVSFLGNISEHLPSTVLQTTAVLLSRLSLDGSVSHSTELLVAIADGLSSIISSFPAESWPEDSLQIGNVLMRTYTSPLTRSRLLTRLPVQSLRTHLFRKRLALGFYYEDSAYFTSSQNELVNLTDIVSRLKSPQFEITPATDYGELKNRLEILDIAVDDGPSKGIPGSQNKPIDDLVNTLKGMSMKIVDGSMTSLLRTEAKQAIESLQYRLTYSLERKGKREQSVLERLFMSEAEGERKKQGVLSLRKNG